MCRLEFREGGIGTGAQLFELLERRALLFDHFGRGARDEILVGQLPLLGGDRAGEAGEFLGLPGFFGASAR